MPRIWRAGLDLGLHHDEGRAIGCEALRDLACLFRGGGDPAALYGYPVLGEQFFRLILKQVH
jgi:hypothetical protein